MNRLESVLEELAHDAPRPTPHPELWDRGRQLRRRDRVVRSGLVLVVVLLVGGLASFVTAQPALVAPAGDVAPDGAIPSRIEDPGSDLEPETDLATGGASVAFVSTSGTAVVIGATDGRYHALDLPGFSADDPGVVALSPDGYHLAWSTQERVDSVDLRTGEVVGLVPHGGHGADVTELAWTYDSARITYQGTFDGQAVAGSIEPAGPSEVEIPVERTLATGLSSPTRGIVALPTGSDRTFARFERVARPAEQAQKDLRSDEGVPLRRQLPPDLYPDGASTRPLGWATGSLVVAQADGPSGSYVEGQHLVLFTSPDRPESEWTFRILVRDLPDATPVSIAVDLVPDLDGTSSQQLTHDFASHDAGLPAGVRWGGTALAALGVLLAAYLLRRREQRRPGRLTA